MLAAVGVCDEAHDRVGHHVEGAGERDEEGDVGEVGVELLVEGDPVDGDEHHHGDGAHARHRIGEVHAAREPPLVRVGVARHHVLVRRAAAVPEGGGGRHENKYLIQI